MSLSIEPLPGPLGAELRSFEPRAIRGGDRALLLAASDEFGVRVARGLDLTPEEHVRLTHVFGQPAIHPIPTIRLRGHPELIGLQAAFANLQERLPAARRPAVREPSA